MTTLLTDEEIARIRAPLAQAWTLPPHAYTDPSLFQSEASTIFYREWICVAREEQIPEVGDYRCVNVLNQPLIVVRDKDNSIKAMSAICPHRGMPVIDGHGRSQSFSCPYHKWKFELDGSLISAPLMDDVELPDNCGLATVRISVWQGFIFVNLDNKAPDLHERLGGLDELVGAYDMGAMRIAASQAYDCPWNWKLLVENFMEAYHHVGPHFDSLQATYPANKSYVNGCPNEGWSVLHMPNATEHEQILTPVPGLTDTQLNQSLASVVMPTFCWINTPATAIWYQLNPKDFDQMELTINILAPPAILERDDGAAIAELILGTITAIHDEDIPVNQGPWQGMNAPLTTQGKLSGLEESIWQLNQWWADRVIPAGD